MHDEFPVHVYFADKDPYLATDAKKLQVALTALGSDFEGKPGMGGSRHYIYREFPARVYHADLESKLVHSATELETLCAKGWSAKPLPPKPEPVAKDVTKAEYEANMRAARAELQMEDMKAALLANQQQMVEMMALLKDEPAKRSHKAKAEAAA